MVMYLSRKSGSGSNKNNYLVIQNIFSISFCHGLESSKYRVLVHLEMVAEALPTIKSVIEFNFSGMF